MQAFTTLGLIQGYRLMGWLYSHPISHVLMHVNNNNYSYTLAY